MEVCAAESPRDTGYDALMAQVDTLLLGRRTYDAVMGFGAWPFVGKRVRVLTHQSLDPHHGECACDGPLREVLATLAAEGAKHIYIDGGDVVRQALAQDLVHEMTLSWLPVVLGRGTRLFETGLPCSAWQLAGSRQFRCGMVQARYCRVPQHPS
jgi:dihydrofolate reductase